MHDARVKVDVWIQFAADEVVVFKGNFLQRHSELEQRIVLQAEFGQHFVAGFAHQCRPWIVILVHAMAKPHESYVGILVLDLGNEFTDLGDTAVTLNIVEHVKRRLVCATVRRAPQAGDTCRDGRKRIGTGGRAQTYGRGGRILLVIRVQNEDAIQCPNQHFVDPVLFGWDGEHHAHEISRVAQVIARVDQRLTHGVLVGHRCEGRQLGNQADCGNLALLFVVQIDRIRVERRHTAHQTRHHRHRMRIATEATQEKLHLLVNHGVVGDAAHEVFALRFVG